MASLSPTSRTDNLPERFANAESDLHRDLTMDLLMMLQDHFTDDPQVYVSGSLPIYYDEKEPAKYIAADLFVVRGVENRRRTAYRIWEEGRGPETVIELTSRATRKEDMGDKCRIYAAKLRVPEYFLFDPNGDYLKSRLVGYTLHAGKYAKIRAVAGRLPSKRLGLRLERDDAQLRLFNPKTGQYLHSPRSTAEEVRAAVERADLAELLADSETRRADLAERLLEVERQRHEALLKLAHAQNERLRQELSARGSPKSKRS
jgi:Uma2 family endonuclease